MCRVLGFRAEYDSAEPTLCCNLRGTWTRSDMSGIPYSLRGLGFSAVQTCCECLSL